MPNASNAVANINYDSLDLSGFIDKQEQNAFAYRAEQRQIDAIEQARQEKEQAKKYKLREKMLGQIPDNYDTGSSSLNEFQAKIIQKGVNRLGEIYKELGNPSLSDDEKIKLEIEAQNIDRLPDNLKIATDVFSGKIKDYKEGVAGGKYFSNPDFEKKVLSGFENYVGGLDNGLPVVGFVDRNQDGKVDLADVVDYNQIQQGLGNWNFQKQFDLDALAKTTGEKLGTTEVQTDKGFVKRITKSPDLKALNDLADNLMVNADGTPKEVALSELRKRNLPVTPENLLKVKQIFKENVLAYTDKSDKTDVDYGAQTGRMAERRQAKKEEVQRIQATFDEQVASDDFNNTKLSSGKVNKNMISVADNKVKFNNLGGDKSRLNNGYITGFALQKDGKIIVTGKALVDKGQKFKVGGQDMNIDQMMKSAENGNEEAKLALDSYSTSANYGKFVREVSGPELAGFAKMSGYNSVNELKSELKQINNNPEDKKVDNKPSANDYGL